MSKADEIVDAINDMGYRYAAKCAKAVECFCKQYQQLDIDLQVSDKICVYFGAGEQAKVLVNDACVAVGNFNEDGTATFKAANRWG